MPDGLKAKCAIERRKISEAMWLDKRICFEVTILDFVQWTWTARSMAKGRNIIGEKLLVFGGAKILEELRSWLMKMLYGVA